MMRMDGAVVHGSVPASLTGSHRIEIEMNQHSSSSDLSNRIITSAQDAAAPDTPEPSLTSGSLVWPEIQGASEYELYRNAAHADATTQNTFSIANVPPVDEVQVGATGVSGLKSFLSVPVHSGASTLVFRVSPASVKRDDSVPFITLDQTGVTGLRISGEMATSGTYSISFRYANGSGPVNTGSKCAIRTLFVDGERVGPVILPEQGEGAWSNWAESTNQIMKLASGTHIFELRFLPSDLSMNEEMNRARIASVDIIPIGDAIPASHNADTFALPRKRTR